MKKRILLLSMSLLLLSCGYNSSLTSISSNGSNISSNSSLDTSNSSSDSDSTETKGYYLAEDVKGDLNENTFNAYNWRTTSAEGNQKIYIVPVQLSDGPTWTNEMINNVEKAFFGEEAETNYQSVSTYFEKSSYGKLHLSGEIGDVYHSQYTTRALDKMGDYSSDYLIAEYVEDVNLNNLSEFDVDGDSYIDNIVFIYSNDYSLNSSSGYWAWCSSFNVNQQTSLKVNNYMWVSYEFLNDGYYDGYNDGKVDAHTFIHETGHLLGLDDYYDYDNYWNCAGLLDMQGGNVGDHNIYSKFALGWVNPYVVTDSCTINLKTSALYPEAILVKNNFKNSIYDEYLLIEFYTPKGLNEIDSKHVYSSSYGTLYNQSGLRIYHVDSRLAKVRYSQWNGFEFVSYTDDFNVGDDYYARIAANNTQSSVIVDPANYDSRNFKYLSLIDRGANNDLIHGTTFRANIDADDTIFLPGDKLNFTSSGDGLDMSSFFVYEDKFNDNTEIGYIIDVGNINGDSIEVKFTKNI